MDRLNLSSEDKLLVYCARTTLNEDITYKVREILNRGLNWDYIMENSMRHGIQSLLYWNLNLTDGGKNVPEEVMAKLKKMYYENAARNMFLYDELGMILRALKNEGVGVIALKGAFLAEAVYRNIGLRPMSDIDLLIKKEDLYKVNKELARLGYSAPVYPTHLHEKIQNQLQNNEAYINQGKKIVVDIHWDIAPSIIPIRVDINKFWENAQPVKIAGIETLTLAPEDSLLHLCLHLDGHINTSNAPHPKFKGYSDIVAVIMHHEGRINWEYLVESSKNYGIEEPVYYGLYIACKYLGAFVPSDVLDALKSVKSGIDSEDIKSTRKMLIWDLKKKRQSREISYFKTLVKVDGSGNKVRILLGDVFPCKEFMMQRYKIKNKKIVYAYYLFRFGTILRWGFRFLRQLLFYTVQRTADG